MRKKEINIKNVEKSKENKKQIEGKAGEEIAKEYLKKIGYKILCTNFRCKIGEIDIIAKDKEYIVFVEVKTRTGTLYGEAKEAVDKKKQKHIYNAAGYYLYINDILDNYTRIDVIEVYMKNNEIKINHLKQVM